MLEIEATNRSLVSKVRRGQDAIALALLGTLLIAACSGGRQDAQPAEGADSTYVSEDALEQTQWQVVAINGAPAVGPSRATLLIEADGQFGGDTSCNRYFGRWSLAESGRIFQAAGVTRRACEPELMDQEQRFLDALASVTRIERRADAGLTLLDDTGASRLELVAADSPTGKASTEAAQDLPGTTVHQFQCDDVGTVTVRFVGPETIELKTDGTRSVLAQHRSASGARYVAEGIEFWNKGDEAMLTVGDRRVSCTRRGEG